MVSPCSFKKAIRFYNYFCALIERFVMLVLRSHVSYVHYMVLIHFFKL